MIERDKVIKKSKNYKLKLKKNAPTRDVVRAAIEQAGVGFGVDWVCHEGKIVTFHNLMDENLPLSSIIDRSTITTLRSQQFYESDRNYENVFKSLLGRCLQQKLYHS